MSVANATTATTQSGQSTAEEKTYGVDDAGAMRDPVTGERKYGAPRHIRRYIASGALPTVIGPRGEHRVTIRDLELMRIREWARKQAQTAPPISDEVAAEIIATLRGGAKG